MLNRNRTISYTFTSTLETISNHEESEDAYHHSSDSLIICDGVGGWKKHGISPSLFSHELCDNITTLLSRHKKSLSLTNKLKYYSDFSILNHSPIKKTTTNDADSNELICKKILLKAAKKCKEKGSSTCTMLILDKTNGQLSSAYIGDSNYMILRMVEGKYVRMFKSVTQRYNIATPYQISNECSGMGDKVMNAIHQLKEDDIVIVASDGLWDNVTDEALVKLINDDPKDLSKRIDFVKKDDVSIIISKVSIMRNCEGIKSSCSESTESNDKIDE